MLRLRRAVVARVLDARLGLFRREPPARWPTGDVHVIADRRHAPGLGRASRWRATAPRRWRCWCTCFYLNWRLTLIVALFPAVAGS